MKEKRINITNSEDKKIKDLRKKWLLKEEDVIRRIIREYNESMIEPKNEN